MVEWRKDEELLKNNFKYQIKNQNSIMELTIKNAQLQDSGLYSCNYSEVKTAANVIVTRRGLFYILCALCADFLMVEHRYTTK